MFEGDEVPESETPVESEHISEAIPEVIPTVVVGKKKTKKVEVQPQRLDEPPIEPEDKVKVEKTNLAPASWLASGSLEHARLQSLLLHPSRHPKRYQPPRRPCE